MDKAQAIYTFWSSFGWDAFDQSSVPDNAPEDIGRYITYEDSETDFGDPIMTGGDLWMKSKRWDVISKKAKEISDALGWDGIKINAENGYIWFKKGRPFSTRLKDEDDSIRHIHLNIEADFISR